MSLVRQNRRTERSIKFVIPSESRPPRRSFMRRWEGSRCDGLTVTSSGSFESEPDWRFAQDDAEVRARKVSKIGKPG